MKWRFDTFPMKVRIVILLGIINSLSLFSAMLAYFLFKTLQSVHGQEAPWLVFLTIFVLIVSLSLVLTYVLSSRLQRAISGPLINLAQTVKTVTHQVQEESVYLEEEVAKRTAELARRNRELKKEIRERVAVEERLQQIAQDLTRSNDELEQFAYVASHDLQEPLRTVASYTGLIQRRYADKLDQDGLDFIEMTQSGVSRMQNLIKGLLAYSRVGRKEEEFKKVDLNQVLADVRQNLAHSLEKNKADLILGDLPEIQGIKSQLSQLFQNLISNALKFHGEEDPVIEIQAVKEDEHWLISVKDNGIGISEEFRERIFVIFQRLHTHDQYPGTGIGLSLVKKIIVRHGGKIWIEENPSGGSIFKFTIP